MATKITFFPVGNGDMSLITLADDTTILIDINIRPSSGESDDATCDVATELRQRLRKDSDGKPFVDVFLLSHPDQDHCRGLQTHFHLGKPDDYKNDPPEGEEKKIFIRELWSSPRVFRRASKQNTLCNDAKAFNKEAKRRISCFREKGKSGVGDGDRILIFGRDENGKTDGLDEILVRRGDLFSDINGSNNSRIQVRVLGPLAVDEIDEEEDKIGKNHSSIILQFSLAANSGPAGDCYYLAGGDAEVVIWEKIWSENKDQLGNLKYDILLAPHHCSWHTLSHDSWKDSDDPKVSENARAALSQAEIGAHIVSSSKPVVDDKNDPPCIGAKKEYEAILENKKGEFICTDEYPSEEKPQPLEFTITSDGPQRASKKKSTVASAAGVAAATEPRIHGE